MTSGSEPRTEEGLVRRKRFIVLLATAALLAASCTQEAGKQTGAQGGGECTKPAALGRVPSSKDFSLASAKRVAPRTLAQGAKKTVKIGFLGDLTGGNAGLIIYEHKAAQLAIKQANAKGDLPVTLALAAQDNKDGAANTAPALAQRLIADQAVLGVVGPGFSGESKTTGALFCEAGLVTVTPSATNPDLTKNGWKTFFRALATDAVQGGQTGDYIVNGLKKKNVAVVNDKSEYGAGLGTAVVDSIKKAGGNVVLDQGIEPTTDYTSLIDSVNAKKPDILYYSGYDKEAPLVLKQYRSRGGTAQFMGGDGDKGTNFLKEGGTATEGAILTCPCLDPNASTDARAQKFAAEYKAAYNEEAGIYSSEGWDATQMLIAAIKAGGANATRKSVLDYITNLKDFKGLSKTFNWTSDHEVVGGEITFVYEVKNGRYTLLGKATELAKS
jgi:branched-chain amino acid transport system substrate-binding protein